MWNFAGNFVLQKKTLWLSEYSASGLRLRMSASSGTQWIGSISFGSFSLPGTSKSRMFLIEGM